MYASRTPSGDPVEFFLSPQPLNQETGVPGRGARAAAEAEDSRRDARARRLLHPDVRPAHRRNPARPRRAGQGRRRPQEELRRRHRGAGRSTRKDQY